MLLLHVRRASLVLCLLVLTAGVCRLAQASGVPTITLTPTRFAALNDGRDTTEIIATVRDSTGRYVPDGTVVTFETNLGFFVRGGPTATATTRNGSARIRLSSQQKGTAKVTARVDGGGFQQLEVLFTDDPAETFEGNTFVAVQSNGALNYYPGERTIEAIGKPRTEEENGLSGANLSFRDIEVFADVLQLECTTNTLRAQGNILVRRGSTRLLAERLYLSLQNITGYAVAEVDKRLRPVKILGRNLKTEVVEIGVAPKFFEMTDLSEANLVITARQIRFFPGDKLQFKQPRFYQDGQALFSMPFYSLSLYSNQLFTDQFLSIGTQGIGVDVPLYYDMTPTSTGALRIRHNERAGRSLYATRPGWSIDMVQNYNSIGGERRYTGELGLTGLNRSDWGFRWNHSQEFSSLTRGSLFLDFPQHRSVYGSTNLSHQMGSLYLGTNLSANRSLTGFRISGWEADFYLETTPFRIGRSGYMFAVGGNASTNRYRAGDFVSNTQTQGVQARFFSIPFPLDRDTTLTNYVTLGNTWTNRGQGGASLLATLSLNRDIGREASMQVTYDFTRLPNLLPDTGQHRVSINFQASAGSKWRLYVYNSIFLDADSASALADFSYNFARRWRFAASATIQRFASASYQDYEFGLAHNIGGRDLYLSWSTFSHRIFFSIEASRF